jgi:hypothetical protein
MLLCGKCVLPRQLAGRVGLPAGRQGWGLAEIENAFNQIRNQINNYKFL